MIGGSAFAHNFVLAGNADAVSDAGEYVVGGISTKGKFAVIVGIVIVLVVSYVNSMNKQEAKTNG